MILKKLSNANSESSGNTKQPFGSSAELPVQKLLKVRQTDALTGYVVLSQNHAVCYGLLSDKQHRDSLSGTAPI